MDNTGNGQSSPNIPPSPFGAQSTANMPVQNQQVSSQQPGSQIPTQQPVGQVPGPTTSQPVQNASSVPFFTASPSGVQQSPVIPTPVSQVSSVLEQQNFIPPTQSPSTVPAPSQNTSGSTVTLNDLYGPSGLADTTDSLSPRVAQQTTQQIGTTQGPSAGVAEASAGYSVPPSSTGYVQSSESSPVSAPDTIQPTVSDKASSVSPLQESIASEAHSQQPESISQIPLRKSSFPQIDTSSSGESSSNEPPSGEKKKTKMNGLLLLRLLFGGIGILLLLFVVIFIGKTLLSFLHPNTSAGKVALVYWGLWEDTNTMQGVIADFERTHPDISIQYEKEDPKDYSQRLLTRMQQGNGPDIFTYHSSWLPMVKPILVPLPTSVVSKDDLDKIFYSVVKSDLVKNGALYGVPLGIDTLSLFVNNKMFQDAKAQVPTSWDTFITTARALTVKDSNGKIKIAGAALGAFDNITHAPDILSALFMQNGVDVTTMTPANNASDALSFYTSFAQGDSSVWDPTLDPSMLAFAREHLAMYFGYSWDIFLIKAANPNLDFSVYPIPHLPGRTITAASYWVEGVSNKSTHQEEALLFMQYLAQKNTMAALYAEEAKTRLFGEPYPRSDLGSQLQGNQLAYPFVSQATDAKSTFFAGETFDTSLNGQMNAYLGNAVRSVLGNTSAQSAIDTLTQGVLQIEKQYGSN